ncbi:MAG: chemotaxis protein CheA, partial [Betaproteobacteria bacterium]|nr:chemotaxis protein CheA [Betaproteobacteria bacterium]
SGKLRADGGMIDAILRATDVIERMLSEMAQGENPAPGPADLGALVQAYASGQHPAPRHVHHAEPPASQAGAGEVAPDGTWVEARTREGGEPGLYVQKKTPAAPAAAGEPAVSDAEDLEAEFERMLDSVYGKGMAPGLVTAADASAAPAPADALVDDAPPAPAAATTAPAASAAPRAAAAPVAETPDTTIRVDSARLDQAMNQVGELVLLRNRLSAAVARLGQADETLARLARETDLAVNDLQSTVMRLRMQPCKRLFQSLPRVVRDASRTLGKKVRLELAGEDVEIDKTVIDALSGPLIHLVRNALDHGLEPPAQRTAAGKPEEGVLRVQAVHLGDKVQIRVSDDGRGMDGHRIMQSALSKGLIAESDAARLSEREMLDLIFLPGFSTKEQVSELSGRGVGMDVVRSAVQGLRGRVDITTRA